MTTRRTVLQFVGGVVVQAIVLGSLMLVGFGSGRQPAIRQTVRIVSLTLPQKPLQVMKRPEVRKAPLPPPVRAETPRLELPPPPPVAVASVLPAPIAPPVRLPAPPSGFTPNVAPVVAQPPKPKSEVGTFSSAVVDGESSRSVRRHVEVAGFESQSLSQPKRGEARVPVASSFDMQAAPVKGRSPSIDPTEFKPVEILSKPNPQYTAQARQLGIEGDVELRVLFGDDGKIRVLSVVRGLGYGLDENAAIAVNQIRFHPAMRKRVPVEQAAVIRVQFQLAR